MQGSLSFLQFLPSGLVEALRRDGIVPYRPRSSLCVSQPFFLRSGAGFITFTRPRVSPPRLFTAPICRQAQREHLHVRRERQLS